MELKIQLIVIGVTVALCVIFHQPEAVCIVLGFCVALLFVTGAVFRKKRETEIENLIAYLMKVQDGLELPELPKLKEGKLGILESEIYKLVALLQEQYQEENKRKKYLVDLLSDISHQIKTPMTAITLMSDLIKTPDLSEEKRLDYVRKIDKQIDRITWLIRNLLTLSQLEADMLPLKSENVKAGKLIKDSIASLEPLADVKNISLITKIESDIDLVCDSQWTKEAISNIVKNCVEHTSCGGNVTVEVTKNNLYTQITISDNGSGIAKEHLPYIFDRFYKTPDSSNSSVGIGLSMSKQIIMRQNGVVDVKSKINEGTRFNIKLYNRFNSGNMV